MSSKKPNVLVIVTDQQRPDLFGAAGRLPIKTPVLDRLCEEGTMFERGYSPCPLCTPARATLVSGQYPSRHRAWSIGVDTPMDVLSLPQILREQGGYRTGIIGKSHLLSCHREGSLEAMPHIRDLDYFRKWTGPWFGFEYAKICVGHVAEAHACGMHYGAWLEDHGLPAEPPYFSKTCDAHEVVGPDRCWALPEELTSCAWVAEEAVNYLNCHAAEHSEEPFYLSVNFPEPHPPFMAPEPWNSMYDDVELPPPNRREGEWEDKSTLYKATVQDRLVELGWHDQVPMACQFIEDSGGAVRNPTEIRKWKSYMGMQSMLDKYLGKILEQLDALGMREDTLVVFTADHGDLLGEHDRVNKNIPYEASVKVPFVISAPGLIPAGTRTDIALSTIDFKPTLLGLLNIQSRKICDGQDASRLLCTGKRPAGWNDLVFSRSAAIRKNSGAWLMAVGGGYKLVACGVGPLWLYDLKEDPDEMINRSDDPSLSEVKRRMAAALLDYATLQDEPNIDQDNLRESLERAV